MTQDEIDVIWSKLANDMEQEEVFERYRMKNLRRKHKGRGEPNQWVYEATDKTKTSQLERS